MKTLQRIITTIFFFSITAIILPAQEGFSTEDYYEFRAAHVDYAVESLLTDYPIGSYYSHRVNQADLTSVPWFDSIDHYLALTADEKEMISNQHFMVTERSSSMSWTDAFIKLYSSDIPLFLSSDFILSTLHTSYDQVLQFIEFNLLEPKLNELLRAMYERFPVVSASYESDARFAKALADADLFITVALSLAEGKEWSPHLADTGTFRAFMDAISSEEMTNMPLFTEETRNRKLDFSQFTPRGHYNVQEYWMDGRDLSNYFRAMMWLGRIDFLLTAPPSNPWEPDWEDEELLRMQLGALVTNEVLFSCGKYENLQKHEEIISFMVGPDDNMNPGELKALKEEKLSGPEDLFVASIFDLFMEALNASDDYGQKIMSNFFYVDPDTVDPSRLPVSFKLLGQKFLIDSYVFHEVVYDRISFDGEKMQRALPDPLDAMAALGNNNALALLETPLEEFKYASNMASLRYLIGAYDDSFWDQSLYNTWLKAICVFNEREKPKGTPYFMKTVAWQQEKLNTQLTSWAQLRHDNILYGKQSYTGGTGCSYPYTYLEPYPELYATIADFATRAMNFFDAALPAGMDRKDQILSYYGNYAEILLRLEELARKELKGEALSESDVTFYKTMINEYMASGPSVTGWYTDFFFNPEDGLSWDFTVADVHTQPTDFNGAVVGNVLHVGNGQINMGVFLADNPCNPGQLMAFAGPVSSFHTEVQANFRRLTDQEWEAYFWSSQDDYPERPDWVAAYLLDQEGKFRKEGRQLKGTAFTGIFDPGVSKDLDYLLVFPNPASDYCSLRFVLNKEAEVKLSVFDDLGRQVFGLDAGMLYPAEHQLELNVQQLVPGSYHLRVQVGSEQFFRKLIRSDY